MPFSAETAKANTFLGFTFQMIYQKSLDSLSACAKLTFRGTAGAVSFL